MGTRLFQCVINIEEMRLLGFHDDFLTTWRISLASSRDWRINLASPLPPPIRSDIIPGRRLSPPSRTNRSCLPFSDILLRRKFFVFREEKHTFCGYRLNCYPTRSIDRTTAPGTTKIIVVVIVLLLHTSLNLLPGSRVCCGGGGRRH